jgi:hypothetical protein
MLTAINQLSEELGRFGALLRTLTPKQQMDDRSIALKAVLRSFRSFDVKLRLAIMKLFKKEFDAMLFNTLDSSRQPQWVKLQLEMSYKGVNDEVWELAQAANWDEVGRIELEDEAR